MQKKLRSKMRFGLLLLVVAALISVSPFTFSSVASAASTSSSAGATVASVAAAFSGPSNASCTLVGSTRTCNLWAKTGTLSLPGQTVTIWGYSDTAGGAAQLPGPTIIANAGETLVVNLTNNLAQPSALSFPEQASLPDMVTAAANTGTKTYTVTNLQAGTSLYEAGLTANGPRQVAMGLYGALVVRPSVGSNQAYTGGATFDDEAVLVFSEIDPLFNNFAATPTIPVFDMLKYNPKYWLINGKSYPQTAAITTASGNKVLLRYLNAGLHDHSIGTLGLRQSVLGIDGKPLTYPYQVVAETLAAGQSLDLLTTVPATAPAGTKYALYNAAIHLDNSGQRTNNITQLGGMLTFLTVGGTSTGSSGPTTSTVAANPTKVGGASPAAVTLTASVASSGTNVSAAEYFVDTQGADGAGTAMSGSFGSANVAVTATLSTTFLNTLSSGNHTLYVHGKDSTTWGSVSSVSLTVDKAGPVTTGTLSPTPTNGSVAVAIQATGNDTTTGNSDVTAAEYYIDTTGGTGTALTIDPAGPSPAVAFTGTISASTVAALSEGNHTINIRSQDAFNQWGAFAAFTLKVDKTGPTTPTVVASPNPNTGSLNFDNNNPGVRVSATFTDPITGGVSSNVVAIEAFLDSAVVTGTGSLFTPTDGAWNSSSENGYLFIPPTTIQTLTPGNHIVRVHAQDAAGNWGSVATVTLIIDKTAPNVTAVTASPNPTGGASTVTLTATATDPNNGTNPGTNIVAAEWFDGADPGVGNGTAFTTGLNANPANLSASINISGWTIGNHTLSVRAKDAATNWSAVATTVLSVQPTVNIFADGFESGTFGVWSGNTGGPTVTPAAAMNGSTRGMQVAVNGTTQRYVTDNSPNNETTYRARFYFNPNNTNTNGSQQDIFFGRSNMGLNVIRVQYRRTGAGTVANPFVYQVRVGTLTGGSLINYSFTGWQTITNAAHSIEIAWQSGASTNLNLYVDSTTVSQTATGLNTSSNLYRIESVRLGAVGGVAGMSGTEYFDAFVSTRGTTVIGP